MHPDELILLDVGSTNSRAWRVRGAEILARRSAPVGVRDSARDGSNARVRAAVGALIEGLDAREPTSIAAAGMITSALGLAEVPHVPAPASLADLAAGIVPFEDHAIAPRRILLVPGVRTAASGDGVTEDVMRGEETLACGLVALGALDARTALLSAGSHWKVVRVDGGGRVAGSRTSLGGEVVHAVQAATVLSASLPEGPLTAPDPAWLDRGAACGRRDGLARALFAARLLDQRGTTTPGQRFAWVFGACAADDLDALLRSHVLTPGMRVIVAGPGDVPTAWAHLLRQAGCAPVPLDAPTVERAFVTGLSAIVGCAAGHSR